MRGHDVRMTHTEDVQEVFYCAAQTYRATRWQPAEYCENEVDEDGDLCGPCGRAEDGPDPDDARDEWLERQWEDRYERSIYDD